MDLASKAVNTTSAFGGNAPVAQAALQPRNLGSADQTVQKHTPIPVYKGNPFRPAPGTPIPARIQKAFEKINQQIIPQKQQVNRT